MFVFYDTETTGLSQDFGQILQIALVFTDSDLNILSTKKLECRRSPWVVPMPGALLTTGFVPDDLKNNPYSHYEMMREVYKWVDSQHWPLTFVGYNSMSFDEGILAQNFYQNLLDPGLTTATNDENGQPNGRADVMVLVKAVAQFMPGVLKLDIKTPAGNASMKLKNVAEQNGVVLSEEDAHDAMNDIKATVGVAKLIKKAAPQIWEHMQTLSTEAGTEAFLAAHEVFTYTSNDYGKLKTSVATAVVEQADSPVHVLFDLASDPTPYLTMTAEDLKKVLLKKEQYRPFVLLRKNDQQILMPMDMSAAALPEDYDEKLYAARVALLRSNKGFADNLAKAAALVAEEKSVQKKDLPELQIGKPVSAEVKPRLDQWIAEFHATQNWKDAAGLVQDFYVRFKDDLAADDSLRRFVKFAGRIVFESAPQELSAEKQQAMKKHIATRLLGAEGKNLYATLADARKELEQIERERAGGKKWTDVTDSQIRALKLYYTSLEKEYAAFLPKPPVNDNAAAPKPPAADKKIGGGPTP